MAEISEAGSVVLQAISEGTFWNDTPGAVTSRLQHAEAAKNWLRTHGLSGTIFSLPPKHPRNPNRSARGKTGGAWKGNLEEYMIRLTNKQGFHGYLDPTKILAELVCSLLLYFFQTDSSFRSDLLLLIKTGLNLKYPEITERQNRATLLANLPVQHQDQYLPNTPTVERTLYWFVKQTKKKMMG